MTEFERAVRFFCLQTAVRTVADPTAALYHAAAMADYVLDGTLPRPLTDADLALLEAAPAGFG